uniref:CASPASE_P10 domain-containing protein n=1 Tax=Macrostomum lignano TaxID=282301 RepID=A0A1I8FFB4_9PLAT
HKPECISCSSCSSEPRNEPGTLCGLGAGGQPEARSLLDSPCLNQLFCSSALLGSIEDAAFLLAGSCPQLPRRFDFWRRLVANGWPELRRILIEQLDGGGRKQSCQAPGRSAAGAGRRQLNRGSASPARCGAIWTWYKAGPLRRNRLLPALRRSLAMQPCGPETDTDLGASLPLFLSMLLSVIHHYRESPHQTVVEFVRRVLQTGMLSLLKHVTMPSRHQLELRPVHPAPSPAARPVGLCCILNIDRYEQADAPTQFHRRQGSACDVENISAGVQEARLSDFTQSNLLDEPDLLMTSREITRTLHCITDLVNLTCSQPMFSRQPKLFVFQFCRGEFVNFYTDGPSQEQSQPGTPAGHLQMNRSYTEVYQCYATLPSYKAMRSGDLGSFFIHYLCHQYAEAQMEAHRPVMLNELMASVNRQLTQQE